MEHIDKIDKGTKATGEDGTVDLLGMFARAVSKTGSEYTYLSLKLRSGEEVKRLFLSDLAVRALGVQPGGQVDLVGVLVDAVAKSGKPYRYLSVRTPSGTELERVFLDPIEYEGLFGGETVTL